MTEKTTLKTYFLLKAFSSFHVPLTTSVSFYHVYLEHYPRFTRVLGVAPLSQIPATAQIINIHMLMVEVKKYKPNF